MRAVISVENLSKAYRLGAIGGGTLKEDLNRWWAKLRGEVDPTLKVGEEHLARLLGKEFWALRDINFSVDEGEVLGVIGRNGAGKSTLLKILSQVTAPSSGEIKIRGRIASLLEVGTGFHPELTGRENIFLNGAILGMSKGEIRRKFDEIVDFSGIAEFIDTPVKRYSSGMYVRLAFAVAAHLEPEILIVDEVLAVGDAEFQKKCLGKMQEVSQGGRTVLFVSHTMQAIASLCSRALLIQEGRIAHAGTPEEVIDFYLRNSSDSSFVGETSGSEQNQIFAAWIETPSGGRQARPIVRLGIDNTVDLVAQVSVGFGKRPYLIASFWDEYRRPLWEFSGTNYEIAEGGRSEVRIQMQLPRLSTTVVSVDLALGAGHSFDHHVPQALSFTVLSDEEHKGGSQRFPLTVEASYTIRGLGNGAPASMN